MPDFDPCGCAVDYLRSCYTTKMRFFANNLAVETDVQWYFCDDSALPLPFPTRFGSGNWASERLDWPGAGEVLDAPRPWRNGTRNPAYTGQAPCGTPDQFLNGSTYPPAPFLRFPNGFPVCCAPFTCEEWAGWPDIASGSVDVTIAGIGPAVSPLSECDKLQTLNGTWTAVQPGVIFGVGPCAFEYQFFNTDGFVCTIGVTFANPPFVTVYVSIFDFISTYSLSWTGEAPGYPLTFPLTVSLTLDLSGTCWPEVTTPPTMSVTLDPHVQIDSAPNLDLVCGLVASVYVS